MWNVLFSFTIEVPISDEEADSTKQSNDITYINFYKIISTENRNKICIIILKSLDQLVN